MNNYTFQNPEYLYLLVLVPVIILYYFLRKKKTDLNILFSNVSAIKSRTYKNYLVHFNFILQITALSLLIIAFARPQSTSSWENSTTTGIDIILAIDISSSMLAQDLKPDRLLATKEIAKEFISGRPNDRIGLVIFSGESFTQCPLTTDHDILLNLFKDVKSGMIQDGTAIGMGLATSVNRLKDSEAISKVIILLTDGENNQGSIAPLTAAKIAQQFGIRVYTIGVGTEGYAPYPFKTPFGTTVYQDVEVNIDEETLQDISAYTNGKYFRATSNEALSSIYRDIDELERSKIEIKEFSKKKEEYLKFAIPSLVILLISFMLKHSLFRTIT